MQLTPHGTQVIEEIARRYYLSADAVMTLLQAVINGGGTMAQFNHPELGGGGQWMQGGMVMVGDMFNNNLKAMVDNLCNELSGLAVNQSSILQPMPILTQHSSGIGSVCLFVDGSGGQWWPNELGSPSSTGSQNNIRYAVFPSVRRLAIDVNGQVTVYDTLDHQITGVGQQQGGSSLVSFISQFGQVTLSSLPVVQISGFAQQVSDPSCYETFHQQATTSEDGDILSKIEKLAELCQRGIVSDEEFACKKSELLSRL